MDLKPLFFYLFAAITIIPAFMVVFSRNLVHSAFALLFTLLGMAALYVLLGADFLGMTQVLVYVGGILILLVFGVMFTQRIYDLKARTNDFFNLPLGVIIGAITFFLLYFGIGLAVPWKLVANPEIKPTASALGELLLTRYLLPFEVISILLLVVLVGAVLVAKKEQPE
ncbi:MAG: NADH-quinone oxidoreductase subunit J [bacterium]